MDRKQGKRRRMGARGRDGGGWIKTDTRARPEGQKARMQALPDSENAGGKCILMQINVLDMRTYIHKIGKTTGLSL